MKLGCQRGFVYPLSLCLLILFSSFLILHADLFVTEKKFLRETETVLKQEYYLLCAVKDIESLLQAEKLSESSGRLRYRDGEVRYRLTELTGTLLQISFTMTMNSQEEAIGFGYYDTDLKKMIKWIEKN